MSSVAPWRLLVDPAADGGWNMAVDEAILEGYERADRSPPPTLRLYGWCPPAVSLGRSQAARGSHDRAVLAAEGIDLVRRPTGGGAVLHEFERTYALAGRLGDPPFTGGVIETYRTIASALARGLAQLGVPASPIEPRRGADRRSTAVCFERVGAWEITVGGRKLVGSAQARRRRAFLQHGSIPIRLDPARLGVVLGSVVDGSSFTDLERAAGRAIDPDILDQALVRGFRESFGVLLVAGRLSEDEALRAAELRCWKYDSMAWTLDGRIGARESRWGPSVGP
jgi:lipoate-protein ligase A